MTFAPLIAAALLGFAPAAPLQSAPTTVKTDTANSFIRREVAEDGTITVQTAGQKYSAPGRPDVWLVGVVHIGLPAYYEGIQAVLDAQEAVLYEGVKPSASQTKPQTPPPTAETDGKPAKKNDAYSILGELIGLEHQNSHINYKRPNWFNSDMSWDEINAMTGEGGGSVNQVQNMLKTDSPETKMLESLTKIPLPGLRDALKVFFVKKLGDPDLQKSGLGGSEEFNRVLLDGRNRVVEKDLTRLISQDKAPASIGVIYGAAHQPAFAAHLMKSFGYTLSETKWFSAASANPQTLDASGKQMLEMLEKSAPGAAKAPQAFSWR